MFVRVFATATLILLSTHAQAVSFNCQKAKTFVEKAICQNQDLSNLDDELRVQYDTALTDNKNPAAFKKQQMKWLKQRDTCQTVDCLKKSYNQRISALNKYNNDPNNFKPDMGGDY